LFGWQHRSSSLIYLQNEAEQTQISAIIISADVSSVHNLIHIGLEFTYNLRPIGSIHKHILPAAMPQTSFIDTDVGIKAADIQSNQRPLT
jgi:hypothetical protein